MRGMDGNFLLEMGGEGSHEWGGVGFIMRGCEILKCLDIVDRGVLFYEDSPTLPIFHFSNVVHPHPILYTPNLPVTSNPHLHCSFCCHVSLAEWVINILLNHNTNRCQVLVSQYQKDLNCLLCSKASNLLRFDTYNLGQMHVISHTETHKHTQHTQGPVN